jgi:drug/metabolite transporter (DMT)-like permease
MPHEREFLEGAFGGLEGALSLALFYRALAMGAMGLTAALTGLLTALVPVLFALWSEGIPGPVAAGGLLLGCVAIWLIAYSPGHETPPMALLLGAFSGVGFGLQLVLLKLASNGGVVWALTSARMGGVAGMLVILLFAWPRGVGLQRVWSGFWWIGILAGGLDTIGNVGYTMAAHSGRLDVAAMVSSLYPGFTILLAAMILREKTSRRQAAGMAVALASVVLLSL